MAPDRFFSLTLTGIVFVLYISISYSQVNFTANTTVPGYFGVFNYGYNPGYYPPFNDAQLANLGIAAGSHSLRGSLYDWFLVTYGLGTRTADFAYYGNSLGMTDLTLFLSGPSNAHRDPLKYGTCTYQSNMFKNMYAPIWDGGKNGTAVNDTNYFAKYVYEVVTTYGANIKFYEIWNEPDFTYNTTAANALPGTSGNWWQNNPNPCDLANTRAPAFLYNRLLRIGYEVIKYYNPKAFIATGGIGYSSYLDVILRNTDNPVDGSVTSNYPLKGGAYFDVLSYHSYPQYDTQYWSNTKNAFVYSRNSDSASDSVFTFKDELEKVLFSRGYNGTTYPKKHVILTETNIPRRHYPGVNQIGSSTAQRNFIVKTMVKAQQNNLKQVYVYVIGDSQDSANSVPDGFDLMGLYLNLNKSTPSTAKLSPTGKALKTLSTLVFGYTYDSLKTYKLLLPSSISGGVFTKSGNKDVYVLWAKTIIDNSEVALAKYSFPSALSVTGYTSKSWDHATTYLSSTFSGHTVTLTGSPVFITLSQLTTTSIAVSTTSSTQTTTSFSTTTSISTTTSTSTNTPTTPAQNNVGNVTGIASSQETSNITFSPNPFSNGFSLRFNLQEGQFVSIRQYDIQGKIVATWVDNEYFPAGENVRQFLTSNLPGGLYFLEFKSTKIHQLFKVVKID
jgi:hypothetical protein